jgi:hypothetical protein
MVLVEGDGAADGFHEAAADGEAKAGATADFLGGDEGLEELLANGVRDARAVVGDAELDSAGTRAIVARGVGARDVGTRVGADGDVAAVADGVCGVEDEVEDDLDELLAADGDGGEVGVEIERELDALHGLLWRDEGGGVLDGEGNVAGLGGVRGGFGTRELEEVAEDAVDALGLAAHALEEVALLDGIESTLE